MRKGTAKRRIKKALIPGYGTKKATEYKSYFHAIIGILFLAFAISVCSGCELEESYEGAGCTAICMDGTYSYSANRSGSCSSHGGVAAWCGLTSNNDHYYLSQSDFDSLERGNQNILNSLCPNRWEEGVWCFDGNFGVSDGEEGCDARGGVFYNCDDPTSYNVETELVEYKTDCEGELQSECMSRIVTVQNCSNYYARDGDLDGIIDDRESNMLSNAAESCINSLRNIEIFDSAPILAYETEITANQPMPYRFHELNSQGHETWIEMSWSDYESLRVSCVLPVFCEIGRRI